MDTAKRSRTIDESDSSDDLIAELAKLIAEDAQGPQSPAAEPGKADDDTTASGNGTPDEPVSNEPVKADDERGQGGAVGPVADAQAERATPEQTQPAASRFQAQRTESVEENRSEEHKAAPVDEPEEQANTAPQRPAPRPMPRFSVNRDQTSAGSASGEASRPSARGDQQTEPVKRPAPSWVRPRQQARPADETAQSHEPAPAGESGEERTAAPEGPQQAQSGDRAPARPVWTVPRSRTGAASAPPSSSAGSQPREPNVQPRLRPGINAAEQPRAVRTAEPAQGRGAGAGSAQATTETRDTAAPANDPIAQLIAAQAEAARAQSRVGATPAQTEDASDDDEAPGVTEAVSDDTNVRGPSAHVEAPAARDEEPHVSTADMRDHRPASPAVDGDEDQDMDGGPDTGSGGDEDHFAVSPVFGVGGRSEARAEPPRPRQPGAGDDADPLDEIENLIGNAVRVQFHPEPQERKAPQSRIDHAYNADEEEDVDEAASAAEAAILAAAAATGSQVDTGARARRDDWAPDHDEEAGAGDFVEPEYAPQPARRKRGGLRQVIVPAAAGTVLLAAGFGLYWYFGMNGGSNGPAPVLSADNQPVKEVPKDANANSNANQSVVLDNVGSDSSSANAGKDEQLVSRDQTGGAMGSDVNSVVGSSTGDNGLVNRKVRTVTVRPDGTIVMADNATAGGSKLPVDRPNVPNVPGNATDTASDPVAAMINAANSDTAASGGADANGAAQGNASQSASDTQGTPQTGSAAGNGATGDAGAATTADVPVPMPRPADMPVVTSIPTAKVDTSGASGGGVVDLMGGTANSNAGNTSKPAQVASATPAQPASASAAAAAGAYVQLAARRDQASAQQSLQQLQRRFASQLGNTALVVKQVDLGDRGTYYRVMAPAATMSDANTLCGNIKSAGGDCLVRSN